MLDDGYSDFLFDLMDIENIVAEPLSSSSTYPYYISLEHNSSIEEYRVDNISNIPQIKEFIDSIIEKNPDATNTQFFY